MLPNIISLAIAIQTETNMEHSSLTNFLLGVAVLLASFVFWLFRRQNYFINHNVPYVESAPLVGVFKDSVLGKIAIYNKVRNLYNLPEVKDKPFFGFFQFHKPSLMIRDPELIKRILIRDFGNFADRYSSTDTHDPLGNNNLFSINNPMWKVLRGKLSPFFSSGKLKSMYYLVDQISDNLNKYVHDRLDQKTGQVEIEVKELTALYTVDVIASCAYGVEAQSLENDGSEFRTAGASMFEATGRHGFELMQFFMLPGLTKLFNATLFSQFGTKFIRRVFPVVLSEREKSGNKRNDLIDTLIELKKGNATASKEEYLSDDHIIAQAAVFFSAGFETSSTTQSFALYEIAKNREIHDRVRGEIRQSLEENDGKVTYDALMSANTMPYLHQIVMETLRIYPIIPMLDRICRNKEGYSLKPFSDFVVPYGMPIYIPVYGIHLDENHFEDPLNFDPERFSPENISKVKACTHFPFGGGPRVCVGERFALMEVKAGLVKILKDFQVEFSEKTPKNIVLEKRSFMIQSDKGLYLKLIKDLLYE